MAQIGTNWMVQQLQTNTSPTVYFRDVTFGNGRFVAVSEYATATSSDGINWFFSPEYLGLQSVASGNGLFVAAGNNIIATTTDGTNWLTQKSAEFGRLTDVAFGHGFFVAIGDNNIYRTSFREESPMWISADGIHWSRRSSETQRGLLQAAFGDGTFVTVATDGAILQSDPLVLLNMNNQLPPELLLSGPTNRAYQIEYVDGLNPTNDWTVLASLVTNSPNQFVDTSWTNSVNRFYRAVLLP